MVFVEIFVVDCKSSKNHGNPKNCWEQTLYKDFLSSLSFNNGVIENKDISVENNADSEEPVADVDEVDREVETNAKNDIIMMRASAAKDSNPNDANGVADA